MIKTPMYPAALVAALFLSAAPSPVQARDAGAYGGNKGAMTHEAMKPGAGVTVTGAWARPTIGKLRTTAAYFQVTTSGDGADKLIGVRTPAAARAHMHRNIMEGGVARMRQVDAVDVVPGTPTVFEPAGYHVMIMGLKEPLQEGDSFPLTLTFDKAGDVIVTVKVTKGGGMDHGGMHKH